MSIGEVYNHVHHCVQTKVNAFDMEKDEFQAINSDLDTHWHLEAISMNSQSCGNSFNLNLKPHNFLIC